MLRVSLLTISSVFIMGMASCENEPEGYFCTKLLGDGLHCIHTDGEPDLVITNDDAIGYQCIHPDFFTEMKKHHRDLHEEIERLQKK